MHLELICIGTELLLDKNNTNVIHVGEKLAAIGLRINRQITVGDDEKELESVFKDSLTRSDVVIATGGLGPTFDDFTREVISKAINRKLVFNRQIMSSIAAHFVQRNIEMPQDNERQANVIDGAEIIPNKTGTAPGQIIEIKPATGNLKTIILLPGPPSEMNPMMEHKVVPYLREKFERGISKTMVLHTFGHPESEINQRIKPLIEMERKLEGGDVVFAILAHRSIIDVKFTVSGEDEMIVDEILRNLRAEFYEILGNDIYGENQQTLESVVGELLMKKKITLAVAESCSGGLFANRVTNVPGSSFYFKHGEVVYSNDCKINLLGVKKETLEQYGAVSSETVSEMMRGVKRLAGTDCAVALTGIAGPGGGSPEKPVGMVYIGIVIRDQETVFERRFSGTRIELKEKFVNSGLDLLRRRLLSL